MAELWQKVLAGESGIHPLKLVDISDLHAVRDEDHTYHMFLELAVPAGVDLADLAKSMEGISDSPTWYRGNFSRSRTNVRLPFCARMVAVEAPAGPPPITIASYGVVTILILTLVERCLSRARDLMLRQEELVQQLVGPQQTLASQRRPRRCVV